MIAGASVAGLMLPEAVAYAAIAGLPTQRAIFAGIAGALAYAAFGRSRFAVVAPTSSSATILAASLAALGGDAASRLVFATLAAGLVGLTFLITGFARLGGLVSFVSRPVLHGFAFGLAITIILRQLPILVGVTVTPGDLLHVAIALGTHVAQWNMVSVLTGLLALTALLALRRGPRVPAALIVLAAGIGASFVFDLPEQGVAVVGPIDLTVSWPALGGRGWSDLARVGAVVPPLFLILLAESWGTMRTLALRHGDRLVPDRELKALGWANLAASAAQGMPVGAGFSSGSANEAAGAASRMSGAIAAVVLATLVLLGRGALAKLPEPVLAAVVIAALTHALDPAPLIRLWRIRRDGLIAVGAIGGVLAFGVLYGMLFAIALSIAALVRRLSSPRLVRLGRIGRTHDFVDVARHADAVSPQGVAIWRPAEPLFFGNAERILGLVYEQQAAEPRICHIILSLEESFDLDSTALDALVEFDSGLQARGVILRLARVRDTIRDLMTTAGAEDLTARCDYSVDDAVTAAERERPTDEPGA